MSCCPSNRISSELFESANANHPNSWRSCPMPSTQTLTGPKSYSSRSRRRLTWLRPKYISGAGIRSGRSLVRLKLCACVNLKTFSTSKTPERTPQSSEPSNLAINRVELMPLCLSRRSSQSKLRKTNQLRHNLAQKTTTIPWPSNASRSYSRKKLLRLINMCIRGLFETKFWLIEQRSLPWLTQ